MFLNYVSGSSDITAEDEFLCSQAALGDRDAEETLVLRYNWLVRSCARPLFLLGADHEDLVQEGMFGLIKAIRDFDPARRVRFSTFAELCIRRRMVSAIRIAAGDKHAILNASLSLDVQEQQDRPSYEDDPETRLIGRETLQERLNHCRLTELEHRVLHLYLQGLTRRELSIKLQKSQKSIDNAIQRIRKKLRDDG